MINMNDIGFVDRISNIGLVNVCYYIVSFGIIFNSKGLIKPEIQNQTVPVFNAFFQYLHESSNATEAKIQLLRQINNNSDGDTTFDMKYLNETYWDIINEGLFAYYGNIIKYLSMRNFAENTNFTALKEIVFDDLSKNYINNVSCSLGNASSNLEINLTQVAIENLFADYLWPVYKRSKGKNLKYGEKRKLQIDRRLKRQVSDNDDDSDDSSNLDMYFAHLCDKDIEELLKATNENLFSDETEASLFRTFDNDPNIQSQARVGTDKPEIPSDLNSINFDFSINYLKGSAEDTVLENLFPNFTESNHNYSPFVDTDSSSPPKIRRIDKSTENQFSSSKNEIIANENGFVNRERSSSNMITVQNNRVLGKPGFEVNVDDIPGTSRLSEESRIERFLESKENRKRLGVFGEDEASTFLGSNDLQFDVEIEENREILNVNDDVGGNKRFITDRQDNDEDSINIVPTNVQKGTAQEGELNVKNEITVQVDYAGRREQINLIFREMKIDTKSVRMQSIANAAIIISSNVLNNYTFEDSLKMLKSYILKLEESSRLVPSYKKLAIDFCKNNLNESEEYQKWKISNHTLVQDILFEEDFFFYGVYGSNERKHVMTILRRRSGEEWETVWKIYKNSTLLQKSLRLVDFTRLRVEMRNLSYSHQKLHRERLQAALYRFAIRECDENTKNIITIYRYRYLSKRAHFSKFSIGDNYTFFTIVDFSADEKLEKSKLNIKAEENNIAFLIQINLETNCGIPNIDRVFEGYGITGKYAIPTNTKLEVMARQDIIFNGEPAVLIIMRYKRLKEERMVEMINHLDDLLKKNSKDFDSYY